MAGRNLLL